MSFFIVLAVLVALNAWVFAGDLAPVVESTVPDYVFLSPPVGQLTLSALLSILLLTVLHVAVVCRIDDVVSWHNLFEWRRVSYLSPLLLLVLPLLTVAALGSPLRSYATPWLFLFIDLQGWFFLAVAVLQGRSIRVLTGHERIWWIPRRFARLATWSGLNIWLEMTLAASLAGAALIASPSDRFSSWVTGDEPKYLRFMENWYRGQGLDISNFPPIQELPDDEPHLVRNLRHVWSGLSALKRDLSSDARHLIAFRALPARPGPTGHVGWFIDGKNGGLYQVHNPGISFLLLPGYVIDRYFLNWTSEGHPQFPTHLYATNGTQLILYVLWGVALFRLIFAYTGNPWLSWLLAWLAMVSLPATAFSYQYYPEVAAGLVLTLLAVHLSSPDTATPRAPAALLYGFISGGLAWLHLRFGLAAVVAGVWYSFVHRHSSRTLIWYWLAFAAPLVTLALYDYHITGNLLPWTLYDAIPDNPGLSMSRAIHDSPGFWFDRTSGLCALAPIYLVAAPGLLPFLRQRPLIAVPICLFGSTVIGLSAAHGWQGGSSTPLRLVTAVVPFLMLPAAETVARYRRSRWFVAIFSLVAVLSVHNSLTYNRNLVRMSQDLSLSGESVSGWNTPLLFPTLDRLYHVTDAPSWFWIAVTAILIALPTLPPLRRNAVVDAHRRRVPWPAATAVVLVAFALTGSLIGAHTGMLFSGPHLIDQNDVRYQLMRRYLAGDWGISWSAVHGLSNPTTLFPNSDQPQIEVVPQALEIQVNEPMKVRVNTRDRQGLFEWGMATVHFGDGASAPPTAVVGPEDFIHTYSKRGDFRLTVEFAESKTVGVGWADTVHVVGPPTPPEMGLMRVVGLPDDLARSPATLVLESVTIGETRVDVRCSLGAHPQDVPAAEYWIWIVNTRSGSRRADLYRPERIGTDHQAIVLTISPNPKPADNELVGVVVGMGSMSSRRRGSMKHPEAMAIRWPASPLILGSPVVLAPTDGWR
jgi:hypothetical protein